MQTFSDPNSPANNLPFEELPRGFVRFPKHIVEGIARLKEQWGYGEEYTRDSLEWNTLVWFYDGLPVAYRHAEDGIEVLALGFEEVLEYERCPEPGVKVVQP
jgi:hypothetical protein